MVRDLAPEEGSQLVPQMRLARGQGEIGEQRLDLTSRKGQDRSRAESSLVTTEERENQSLHGTPPGDVCQTVARTRPESPPAPLDAILIAPLTKL